MKEDLVQQMASCLPLPKAVVAFVGAGGKTTCLYQLAEALLRLRKKVLVTTTTKMFHPQYEGRVGWNLFTGDICTPWTYVPNKHGNIDIVAKGIDSDHNKLIGFAGTEINETVNEGRYDFVLVEADGAKQKPVKAPASREPVIPDAASLVFGLIGLDSLGKPLTEAHVHRPDLLAKVGLQPLGSDITESTLAKLILSENGLFKDSQKPCRNIVILNKADNRELVKRGMLVKELLKQEEHPNFKPDKVLLGQMKGRT